MSNESLSDVPNEPEDGDPRPSTVPPFTFRPPRNIKIVVEYDGAGYAGWEKQKTGLGVEEVVRDAVQKITGEKTTINGAGRTDAGVHASGQVASFTILKEIPVKDLVRALNAVLPDDVAIVSGEEVDLYFHARFSAISKIYRYHIWNAPIRSPLHHRRSFHIRADMDLDEMRRAADCLEGTHDFAGFAKETEDQEDTVRTVRRIAFERHGGVFTIDFEGDGFLYNMVRILAGTLIDVGLRRKRSQDILHVLATRDRKLAGPTLPARGLELVRVFYPR